MSAEYVRLPVPAVTAHAEAVDDAGQAILEARSAVASVALGGDAYGQLCRFLPTVLGVVFEAAAVAMAGSAESLQETAYGLRGAVSSLVSTDDQSAASLGESARDLR
ncbi:MULTISPECIES: hypothetical protein [Actinoplanes]|uniref:hypothetical protein n=1 Tax=Actinoplanes TaxID=1865 RepID=UPI000695C2AF|nr:MULTISPECIES: hypothetical protein [Actinoplanes]GLY06974.1 hypothetical protein Acsp01_73530 [Actinoplanes sp. NBRC 101535]